MSALHVNSLFRETTEALDTLTDPQPVEALLQVIQVCSPLMVISSRHIIPLCEPKVNITRAAEPRLTRLLRFGDRFSPEVISLCLAQGEEVDPELGAGVGVRGAGLIVVDAVGVEVVVGMGERTVGVGVGGGGVGNDQTENPKNNLAGSGL
jgi:hypothetical protein